MAHQRAATKAAMGRRASAETTRLEADRALHAWVANEFGVESAQAIDFGFPPARKGTMTAEAKALAVARRKATREARRTMGKRQKVLTSVDEHSSPPFSMVELRAVA